MYRAKAKARIVFEDKVVGVGQLLELTEEQMEFLGMYVEDVVEVKEDQKGSDKPKQASSKGKAAKK